MNNSCYYFSAIQIL